MRRIIETILTDITALGSMVFSVIVLALVYTLGAFTLGAQLLVGIAAVVAISVLCKVLFFTERPKRQRRDSFIEKIDASSFPSIHAARITVIALLAALHIGTVLVWAGAVVSIILVAASRIVLQKHYLRDVIAGIALGVIVVALEWKYF